MSRQKVDSEMIVSIAASKLTGALPALDGSALTGITGMLKGASDPVVTTNPAGGVGSVYLNTADGEMFVCTDATAGANVWTNVGGGDGNVEPYTYQGTQYGYTAGAYPALDVVDKFSLASDGNAADVGNLLTALAGVSSVGCSGETYGYVMGGWPVTNVIQKTTFATDSDSTDVGDLSQGTWSAVGSNDQTNGYCSGGWVGAGGTDVVNKFAMVSTTNASDIGNLTQARTKPGGSSDPAGGYGYVAGGGNAGSVRYDRIDRNSFASNGDSTDVGNMTSDAYRNGGSSSLTHGFTTGGEQPSYTNSIQKYAFASSGDASDVGDISGGTATGDFAGQSGTSHGYCSGGGNSTILKIEIQKYATASNANATDIGNLTVARKWAGGFHY